MSYEWKIDECNANGIPHSKIAPSRLEKDGVTKKFRTSEELAWAWKNGWYEPNRPETADEVVKQDKWPKEKVIEAMDMDELEAFIEERNIPDTDKRWGFARLKKHVIEFIDYPAE